jgi:hypothetical protein
MDCFENPNNRILNGLESEHPDRVVVLRRFKMAGSIHSGNRALSSTTCHWPPVGEQTVASGIAGIQDGLASKDEGMR